MTIKLYCFGESGHSYKAALALNLMGLDWDAIKVDFFAGETRSEAYRSQVNELGEAPVMVDGDVKLTQSGVIQQYLAEKTGKFGGKTKVEEREVLRWILWDNHKLSSMAGMTRFLMNFLPPEKQPAETIAFNRGLLSLLFLTTCQKSKRCSLVSTLHRLQTKVPQSSSQPFDLGCKKAIS